MRGGYTPLFLKLNLLDLCSSPSQTLLLDLLFLPSVYNRIMPEAHEGRRPFKYRHFIICDDPRGVVECGALRKHKWEHQIKTESQSHRTNQKFPKDLLKGGLHVGDSLSMLSRLHLKTKIERASLEIEDEESHVSGSSADAPSTSSSQSSILHSSNCVSPDSSLLSSASKKNDKKPKGSSLITKLMGLGSVKKVVNQKKPAFDLDSPARKLDHDPWMNSTLDQMIQVLKFKSNTTRFSCLNIENPIVPKPKSEIHEEIIRVRTNPLADTHEFENLMLRQKVSCSRRKPQEKRRKNSKPTSSGEAKHTMLQILMRQYDNEEIEEDSTRLAEDASQIEITDYGEDDQSSPSETPLIVPITTYNDKESEIEEEENCVVHVTPRKGSTSENKLKLLLLSSEVFIDRVEELFNLKANLDKDMSSDIDEDSRMLVDTAIELVECKRSSVRCCYTCLEQVVDEVCEGIESLNRYIKDDASDNLVLLVKGDLRNSKMVTGMWDIGWTSVGSAEEMEEIARGVDELVFDGLIQEILAD